MCAPWHVTEEATPSRRAPRQENLVDDPILGGVLHQVVDRLEMGDLEGPYRPDRQLQSLVSRARELVVPQPRTRLP